MISIEVFVQSWKNSQKGRMVFFLHHKSCVYAIWIYVSYNCFCKFNIFFLFELTSL